MPAYEKYHSYAGIRWHTLRVRLSQSPFQFFFSVRKFAAQCSLFEIDLWASLATGTLSIGCIRYKHGRIRWHTLAKKFVRIRTYALYDKHRHTLNTLEVRQMYGTHTLAFQWIFVRMKIISLIFIRFSYVSLIRNSVTGPLGHPTSSWPWSFQDFG
jgi:hypothetical protein